MNLVLFTLSLHVLVAVLGVGTIAALPLSVRSARRAGLALDALAAWALPLLLMARVSLLLGLLSGALLDFVAHGPFHEAWWFRLSGLLVVVTALCLGRGRAALIRGLSGGLTAKVALRRIESWGFTSVITVACIVLLMVWKPF